MLSSVKITFAGEKLVLNADRTLWWPARRTLFVADMHVGKSQHMRRYGIAVPVGTLESDLSRLDQAIETFQPEVLLFLGDLFHSERNAEWDVFMAWCRAKTFRLELVVGNHDRFFMGDSSKETSIAVHNEPLERSPFELRHHPIDSSSQFVLAGHVHPMLRLHGPGGDSWRLPCFLVQDGQIIMPAFSEFTGGQLVGRLKRKAAYACSPDFSAIITIP